MTQNDSSSSNMATIHIPRPLVHRQTTMIKPFPSHNTSMKSEESQAEQIPFATKVNDFLNGLFFNIFISIITLYVLFADDFRQIFCPPSADLPFTIVLIICMTIFIAELILSVIAKPEYVFNFFFWLDLISVGTMVFDLMWINVGGAAGVATNIVQITRAGKATRIGARSARIIRIVKLMRSIQEYKNTKQQINDEAPKPLEQVVIDNAKKNDVTYRRRQAIIEPIVATSRPDFQQNLRQEIMRRNQQKISTKDIKIATYSQLTDLKETRVSLKLKQALQITTTVMIILLLLSVPLLSSSTWFQQKPTYQSSIRQLDYFLKKGIDNYTIDFQMETFINQSKLLQNPIVYMKYPKNQTCCEFPKDFPHMNEGIQQLDDLRASSTITEVEGDITVVYNTTQADKFTSELNIGRTLFVITLLILTSLFLIQDIQDYILQPLDSMLNTVKRISSDPLKAMISIENQKLIKSMMAGNTQENDKKSNQYTILEDMIMKIGSLLVVGFGEAGSQIIVKNIETTHGAINPVLSGTKMIALFGFCDIRNFTDATQVLQTGVMNFVNDVAEIVHGIIHKYAGSANKNIGDAFLLVWKFKQKQVFLSQNNGKTEVTLRKIKKVSQIADLAVYSFMKIIAQLTKAHQLKKYSNDKGLKERIKNFTGVKMGFGLHVGWAIEGAIGSKFKIDASYLSPNVNMASRLQAATKQFGVLTLFSGQIVQLMTPNNRKFLRQIDRVTVKGSIQPIDLYTLDIIPQLLAVKDYQNQHHRVNTDMQRKKNKMFTHKTRELIISSIQQGKNITQRMFTTDKDFLKMRQPFTSQFYNTWKQAFQLYIKGCWGQAKSLFQQTQNLNDFVDGPSTILIQVIQANDNRASISWEGYRQLTEK